MSKTVSIITKLTSSLGRRDEIPNQQLAKEIVSENNKNAISELVDTLKNKDKAIQNDCIKVLYEIGDSKPELISKYADTFISFLSHKNNRLQWGAMIALNTIALEAPKIIFSNITHILAVADKGSVITKDNTVKLLVKLCSIKEYSEDAFFLLNEQLLQSPLNQFPMYAELSFTIADKQTAPVLIKTLKSRLPMIEKESKRKRVEKVIQRLNTYISNP